MFTVCLGGVLALGTAGCAVVGYPAPAPAPVGATRVDVPLSAPRPRTYTVLGQSYTTLASAVGYRQTGLASWYGDEFNGRPTASGETFDMNTLTAAHRTLPLQTCVEVERVDDGRKVIVRVNDRGPFDDDQTRIIDLSFGAAKRIGLIGPGTTLVEVRALEAGTRC